MMVDESLSYFTSPLKIKPAISDELESVAKIGFILDGFAEVARCKVEATRCNDKKRGKKNLKLSLYNFIIYTKL